jgi:hypothetical protein
MKAKSFIVILFWLLIVGGAFGINVSNEAKSHKELAFQTARAFFKQIVLSRTWNAGHGGVYVQVTETTRPNPYLDDPQRDIESTEGLKLTKINPAFMTRQIAEIASREDGIQFHITSLKPIRPDNKPASWERTWLETFEEGVMEQGAFAKSNTSGMIFRYMAPLITEQNCLKCHAKQGYELGDIRGGISVSLPFFPRADYSLLIFGYGIAAIIGSLIIYIAGDMLDKKDREQKKLIVSLQKALNEIKTLEGIVPICSFCKKVRDDEGFWKQVESYVSTHTEAQFSHGVCPTCMKEHYPGLHEENDKE